MPVVSWPFALDMQQACWFSCTPYASGAMHVQVQASILQAIAGGAAGPNSIAQPGAVTDILPGACLTDHTPTWQTSCALSLFIRQFHMLVTLTQRMADQVLGHVLSTCLC